MTAPDLDFTSDPTTGQIGSVRLYGVELLDTAKPCVSELWVNGAPLPLRPHVDPNFIERPLKHLKGERFVDHFTGWGLVVAREIGGRTNVKHPCVGITTLVRRELADQTCPCPGPGGPVVEAPLWVDTFSLLNWNWRFWGDDTRMVFPSTHSTGPSDEAGHLGYEHGTPEDCKRFLVNSWRRIYPGVMVVHGGLFYNARTGHWLAITCRRPGVGYQLNVTDAGRGVGYDFTLHTQWGINQSLHLPEIKVYYGADRATMMSWLADYATFHYEEPPAWFHRTVWGEGLGWNNQPTWTQQADYWERKLAEGTFNGIGYSLVTNRPVGSGTTPLGYEPDPNHGTQDEFRAMCRRLSDRGVPILIWMSHSGVQPGGPDIDDDWFIRGIDGRMCRSWGTVDGGMTHTNPGHPGYIEYTKKWIRYYITECGCKGIFFDCLGWAFPCDFAPRPFMRFPGDTNLMGIRFMREIYACIKECDPDAIMLGEGTSLDGPVNVFSANLNPVRAIDGMGPRDFLLDLNRYGGKQLAVDQGPRMNPAAGMCTMDDRSGDRPGTAARNRYFTRLVSERGGRLAFTHLPNDLSVLGDLLFVPVPEERHPLDFTLPQAWAAIITLVEEIDGAVVSRGADGRFTQVPSGIYRMRTADTQISGGTP